MVQETPGASTAPVQEFMRKVKVPASAPVRAAVRTAEDVPPLLRTVKVRTLLEPAVTLP
jgi:hypothetical protein